MHMTIIKNIIKQTQENEHFRQVLHTGDKSQLVIMNISVQGEIGEEVHPHVEQTLFFLNGNGTALLDGVEHEIAGGDVLIVHPGVRHNVVNTGDVPLKIYTIYAPANHIDGRIHVTKADADEDTEDEEFGHQVM